MIPSFVGVGRFELEESARCGLGIGRPVLGIGWPVLGIGQPDIGTKYFDVGRYYTGKV